MARFSLEDEADERERPGPSSPNPKRQKLTIPPRSQPAVDPPAETDEEVDAEEEEESEHEIEAGEEESEYEDEEGEEGEEDDDGDQDEEESENHHQQQLSQPEVIEVGNRDGPISVTLTDPDVLDCPICLEPLSIPVFQCENGHVACTSCCSKIRNKCPSCSWPIGYNRCRAIEKVLESVKVSCRNLMYGCTCIVKYCHKLEHDHRCIFTPCSCPLLNCNFVGSCWHMGSHFNYSHPTSVNTFLFDKLFSVSLEKSQKFTILRESNETIIFILNHFSESRGSAINIVCLAPPGSGSRFSYELKAIDGDTSIQLLSSVESITKWVDCPPARKFLLVPSYYTSSCGRLKLNVRIRKDQSQVGELKLEMN
ncbi:hypothetical protein ACH5RR_013877 [Cinchona calisaya]|uniref:RING-type E3 ubiquitin transferase n=1 Tax=Cinchona calisaya TaxID=153742 RepID=A0ABD3A4Q6_9GENT